MRVKILAYKEHNAVPRPGHEPVPLDPEASALTIRPPLLPRAPSTLVAHRFKTPYVDFKYSKPSMNIICPKHLNCY